MTLASLAVLQFDALTGASSGAFVVAAVALILFSVLALFVSRYKRCPANRVLVISGKVAGDQSARVISGGGAFVWPVIQQADFLSLLPLQIDINLTDALSLENIRVRVPSQVTVAIGDTEEYQQNAAARILGVKDVIFMGRQDGTIVHDLDLRRDLTRIARKVRPDVVITDDPSRYWFGNEYINHPDHRATAEAALAAAFPAAGNRLYFPELLVEGLEPYKIKQFYVSSPVDADTFVDISDYMDTKIEALRAHASQMVDWDPDETVREWSAADGQRRNPPVAYAEDFKYFQTSG